MSCSGSANVSSGVALIRGPRLGPTLRNGSYRDRREPPQVVDGDDKESVGELPVTAISSARSRHHEWPKSGRVSDAGPVRRAEGPLATDTVEKVKRKINVERLVHVITK